jgi:hypothetical protein
VDKGARPKDRTLNVDELGRLGSTLLKTSLSPPAAAAAIHLIALTGARREEVVKLKWVEVDFSGSCLQLGDSKTVRSKRELAVQDLPLVRKWHSTGASACVGSQREQGIRLLVAPARTIRLGVRATMIPLLTAAALACVALSTAAASAKSADYAGSWNVLITGSTGECEGAFRYTLNISRDGSISYGGPSNFTATGRVDEAGRVQVRISRGADAAEGSGRLQARAGRGTWRAPSTGCSGAWRAEKR